MKRKINNLFHIPPADGYQFSICQRFPNCGTYPDPIQVMFNTKEDLFNIPFIKSWVNPPPFLSIHPIPNKVFLRFTIDYRKCGQHILFCEYTEGVPIPMAYIKGSNFEILDLQEIKKD